MKNKIKLAREILDAGNRYRSIIIQSDILEKLKEITDRAELSYNDVKIKRIRSKAALVNMKKLEHELQQLLLEVKN